jgi:beta-lactamase regulating signal transducer with metallopeptidase domain
VNAIGIALIWCVVQVTLIGILASGLYLLAHRFRPAAAASVAFSGLVTIIVLSLLAFSPWPRWIRGMGASSPGGSTKVSAQQEMSGDLESEDPRSQEISDESAIAGPVSDNRLRLGTEAPRPTILQDFLSPRVENPTGGWRWPAQAAAILLALAAFGVGWLAVGIFAVRLQRKTSIPVNDRELTELIDVLCAELDCLRPIEVRQCDNLVTAATIGWRRPTLLLPSDWRTWTDDERRAVLAHEIVHARGHDCLTLFCGQLALILHFYHPLLHWLADHLRLEQELAADAAAARVSGGQHKYLTTIAELALRQQDRPLLWPARTFLPTRTTFMRRVIVLRDKKLSNQPVSSISRLIAAGTVLLGGLLVVGLRGPATYADAAEPSPAAQEAGKEFVRLGSVGESSPDKRSIGGSGHAISFHRPAEAKYLATVQIYASRYGLPQPPQEDIHLYVLDKNQKVLHDFLFPYSLFARGPQKWQKLYLPATEVPEEFQIGLSFNPHQTKGIYLGLDKNVEESHSYIGLPESGYKPVPEKYDWMVRAFLVSDASKAKVRKGPNVGRLADAEDSPNPSEANNKQPVRLSYVGETSADKRSIGGSGHAIAFHRPADAKYLAMIQIYASRYGLPQPPQEDIHVYVLDKDHKVLHDFLFPYSLFARGPQKWQKLYVPATEVPEEFQIGLSFNPHQTKGIYLGLDKNVAESHSYIGLPNDGFEPVPEKYDWMVRAFLVSDASQVKVPKGPSLGRAADAAGLPKRSAGAGMEE